MSTFVRTEKPDLGPKIRELPHKPGVYLMRDRLNRVIYVGKAKSLRKRVGQYFMPSRRMVADLKTRALLDSIWDFEVHVVRSEPEALLLEGKLIKEFRPKYNVSFRDDKRFLLVKVDEREDWPRFRLTRIDKGDGARYFGPFAHAGALRQTLNLMRKKFGVLTFGRGTPSARELKSSTYQVPMKLADISADQYRVRVTNACEFLEGRAQYMLDDLEAEMKKAAAALDFEKAAELRNMLSDLKTTTKPMHRYTRNMRGRVGANIDPASDMIELQDALRLPTLPRRMECFDISNISSTHIVASMVCFVDGRAANHLYRRYRIKSSGGQNDFASMAEVVRRRYSRVLTEAADENPDDAQFSQENPADAMERLSTLNAQLSTSSPVRLPDLIIVDGGKGQLSSACKELQRLGLHAVPIVGLAKEFEEIYRPGESLPLRLSHDTGALKLMQRIRDEAHRFANGYHQLLLKRRIGESLLDDCPGVSENRKQLLLKQFGSVARLRKASVEQIAATEGIGKKLAETLVEFLAKRG
jgi:excinuclease ABC subunit C